MLSTLKISPDPVDTRQPWTGGFAGHELLSLGAFDAQDPPKPGKSLVFLYFDLKGKPLVFRLSYKNKRTLLVSSSEPISISRMYRVDRNDKTADNISDESC